MFIWLNALYRVSVGMISPELCMSCFAMTKRGTTCALLGSTFFVFFDGGGWFL